eukprot:TRINITY_DN1553_c1_g2_i1.p1 TRINITY_DN1553_c1_g2~~TRINITY_DN1553_c1_g2_i1.p1  ORF type:complete len:268 (-),score=105.57 TRINITY_DN1553_c1_g2_i1:11-814(-)
MATEDKDKKVYASASEFLADSENEVDEKSKTAFEECSEEIQQKVMARGDLSTAKNKSTAMLARIRDAKYDLAVEKGEEIPEDARRKSKKDKKRGLDGDGPKKPVEIDIDLKHPGANAKTEVTSYLQTKLGRAMNKDDFCYKTEKFGGNMWLATLECPCLEDASVSGEPSEERKVAEQSAAKAFLEERREEIEEMNKDARPLVIRDVGQAERRVKKVRTEDKDSGAGDVKGKGKGWGKGYDGYMPMPMFNPMMMMMMMKGKSMGKGKW